MEAVTSIEDVNLLTRCSSEEEARLVGVALFQMLYHHRRHHGVHLFFKLTNATNHIACLKQIDQTSSNCSFPVVIRSLTAHLFRPLLCTRRRVHTSPIAYVHVVVYIEYRYSLYTTTCTHF